MHKSYLEFYVNRMSSWMPGNLFDKFHFEQLFKNQVIIKKKLYQFKPMMKISVITDISVLSFYGYIGYIGDISTNILT